MANSVLLGIESTAHTFGLSIVEGNARSPFSKSTKFLSNVNLKYPAKPEGFVPRKLADFHARNFPSILAQAVESAGVSVRDLDAVAYSYGPGLGHSLHLGHIAAKSLAQSLGIPVIGVNHGLAHLEVARFHSRLYNPLALYVSGGNTQVLSFEKQARQGRYRTLGETLDIGVGNFLDLVGRQLRLSPPDAVGVVKTAQDGKLIPLPYVVKGMNVSFSGLSTAVNAAMSRQSAPDVCYSAQETAFAMICEVLEKALVLTKKRQIILGGGNARNQRLQDMVQSLCQEHGVSFGVPPFEFCGDNAGMIALVGLSQLLPAYGVDRVPDQKVRVESERVFC